MGIGIPLLLATIPLQINLVPGDADLLQSTANAPVPAIIAPVQGSTDNVSVPRTTPDHEKSSPGGKFDLAAGGIINNVWGAPAAEKLSSGVFHDEDGRFGWYWDRPSPGIRPGQPNVQPIYPSTRIGGTPWEHSRSRVFPIRLGDATSLKFDLAYKYLEPPAGAYDLAFDFFMTDSNQPSAKPEIRAEVMVWLHGTKGQPPFSYGGDFSDGHNTYSLHSWIMQDGRHYYAFVLKGPFQTEGHHAVDAGKLIEGLRLDPGWYIHGIELGNEVWNGSGRIEIGKFNVTVNGLDL